MFVVQFGITGLVAFLQKRELRQKRERAETVVEEIEQREQSI